MVTNSNNGRNLNPNKDRTLNFVTTNHFYVEIGGTIAAAFTECSGLNIQIKKNVFYEGGLNDQQRIHLGHAEFADVTLKHGITNDLVFWDWISEIFDETKKTERRNVNIIVFNQAGQTVKSWTLIGAIPIVWKSQALQADGNAVAIEELTLAYEGLQIAKEGGGGNQTTRIGKSGFFHSN